MTIYKKEFLEAALKGNLTVIDTYIAENRNNPNALNVQDEEGSTAVHLAVWARKKDCLESLIKAGANVNITQNYENRTPLHVAANKGWLEGTKLLLEAKADVHKTSTTGVTPCHLAVSNADNEKLLKMLIEAGADISVRDNSGKSPIASAMCNGRPQCVLLLLNEGAEIEEEDKRIFHYNYRSLREDANAPFHSMKYLNAFGCTDSDVVLDNFKKVETILLYKTSRNVIPSYETLSALTEKSSESKQESDLKRQISQLTDQIKTLTGEVKTLKEVINFRKEPDHNKKHSCLPRLFNR